MLILSWSSPCAALFFCVDLPDRDWPSSLSPIVLAPPLPISLLQNSAKNGRLGCVMPLFTTEANSRNLLFIFFVHSTSALSKLGQPDIVLESHIYGIGDKSYLFPPFDRPRTPKRVGPDRSPDNLGTTHNSFVNCSFATSTLSPTPKLYIVTIHVVPNLPLTSKLKFRYSMRPVYKNATFVFGVNGRWRSTWMVILYFWHIDKKFRNVSTRDCVVRYCLVQKRNILVSCMVTIQIDLWIYLRTLL